MLNFPPEDNTRYWRDGKLTTPGAAKVLGVSTQTLRNYIKDDRFPDPEKRRQGQRYFYMFTKELVQKYQDVLEQLRD